MTEFKVGDIVRLTKGKRGEPGFIEQVKRVGPYTDHLRYESVVALTELPTFIRTYNWTVELIERPAPPCRSSTRWRGGLVSALTKRLKELERERKFSRCRDCEVSALSCSAMTRHTGDRCCGVCDHMSEGEK